MDYKSLFFLGLNAYESSAYLALLGRPAMTPTDISRQARVPRQRIYDVLDSLEAKGLCSSAKSAPKTYSACDPRDSLQFLANEQVARLERQSKELREDLDDLVDELAPVYEAGRQIADPLAYVEVLTGSQRIAYRAHSMASSASHCVNACISLPLILTPEQNRAFLQAPAGRQLEYRVLIDSASLQDLPLRSQIDSLVKEGLHARVVSGLPLKMQTFDDESALVSMQDPTASLPAFTAIAIQNRGFVAMLNLAFESLWNCANPWELNKEP